MILLAMTAIGFLPSVSRAAALAWSASSPEVSLGETLSIDLLVDGLDFPGPDSLGGFALTVSFYEPVLEFLGADFGPHLGTASSGAITRIEIRAGQIDLIEVSLLSETELHATQPASFLLATLHLSARSVGSSRLEIGDLTLGDAFGNPLTSTVETASITVVPEPGTACLIGLGLLALARTCSDGSNGACLRRGLRWR